MPSSITNVSLPPGNYGRPSESRWVAVYTVARHEQAVARQLEERNIETFLPLYRSVHRWKDRKKEVELALFPSYVFVRMSTTHKLQVLQVPGVVHIVGFNGEMAALPEQEIEALRNGLDKSTLRRAVPISSSGQACARHPRSYGRCRGHSLPQKGQIPRRNFGRCSHAVGCS
jgi:transcription antitermination factor NusG